MKPLSMTCILAMTIYFMSVSAVAKELSVAAMFSDNMVLQQQSEAEIWGKDKPNTSISVSASWGEKARAQSDDNGNWKLRISTPEAKLKTSYRIDISGTSDITIQNVQVGEVWLCSGQSNMEMPVKGFAGQPVNGSNNAILMSKNQDIRMFKVARKTSDQPLHQVNGKWQTAWTKSVSEFSAVCYFFGKQLYDVLKVPVGLIASSWGGTPAESWTPKSKLESLDLAEVKNTSTVSPHRRPSVLYNGMISPLVGYSIKGILWYQGEANRSRYSEYADLLSAMISAWRTDWKDNELPFYIAQIAPFGYFKPPQSAFLREAQLKVSNTLDNVGMAVTLDLGDCNNIHPAEKQTVSERLAYWALAKDYGVESIGFSGPVYKSMSVKDGKAYLQFDYADMGLASIRTSLKGFTISGEDRVFHPAEAFIAKDSSLSVWSEKVESPVAVRYAFENCPEATLYNTYGLPASSFRTDNWQK